jgi:speckle-type POZ protein
MATDNSQNPSLVRIRRSSFQLEIDYSKSQNLPVGTCISSPTFTANGYDWVLDYYPHGDEHENRSHVSVYLSLESEVEEICVQYTFYVLDKNKKYITIGNTEIDIFTYNKDFWGYAKFIARDSVEKLYCVNGFLVISCSIRVLDEPKNVQTYPGGLYEDIEKLWEKGRRFDVTFEVEGESISAHRFMLAARSPVFESKLFGPMAEAKMEHIKIDEMKAEVFKALLHFVYTDQLAEYGSSDHETLSLELLQDLFAAADRYGLEKLTLLCEHKLEKNLSVGTVVTTLLLADRHCRADLKNKCLDFASSPENFSLVALTEGYFNIMPGAPSLFAELSEMIKHSSRFAKKQRTY